MRHIVAEIANFVGLISDELTDETLFGEFVNLFREIAPSYSLVLGAGLNNAAR